MNAIIEKTNQFLTCFLYKIGIRKKDAVESGKRMAPETPPSPPLRLITNAHALLVHHNGDTALDEKEMREYRERKKMHLVARYGGEKSSIALP